MHFLLMPQKLKSSALAAGKLWHRFPGQSDEKISPEPPGGQSPALPFPQPSCALTGGESAGQQLLVSCMSCALCQLHKIDLTLI